MYYYMSLKYRNQSRILEVRNLKESRNRWEYYEEKIFDTSVLPSGKVLIARFVHLKTLDANPSEPSIWRYMTIYLILSQSMSNTTPNDRRPALLKALLIFPAIQTALCHFPADQHKLSRQCTAIWKISRRRFIWRR